ncbi:hypothetical protein HDV05_001846 [Chytridiales sp. JEL 0842]|nr:hypothetical protein HDV05_001846 [Chytridiales sp. JEL 0842]
MESVVSSEIVKTSSLHNLVPSERHLYSYPFSVFYLGWLYLYFAKYDELFGSREFAFLTFILVVALHILAFLVCQWSVNAKTFLTCKKETDPYKAQLIKIIPVAHQGSSGMCDIMRSERDDDPKPMLYFFFQKRKFVYDDEKKQFTSLRFPFEDGLPMSTFNTSKGLSTGREIKVATDVYGLNRFDIPIPTFVELFKEHAVAPFFVFQMFCVALWFLDEMWYYSLFTLFMLVVFESTVVFQRLKNLQEFRSMSIKPYPIYVYRLGTWTQIQTDELLPGDICSILRSKDDQPVPADLAILEGSCIANEAMLSGESTPQLKESTSLREEDDIFDIEADKNYCLFGGTKVLQVTAPVKTSATKRIVPPDGGCVAYVLRTGFSTQQGALVRTIIYSTERVTANNLESLLFILFLLIFAIAAAYYVWTEGIKNEERKRSKVLLDCILIITSVVPPELPMELSLAVNNSLIALAKGYIFCTEPFRIPFAGKVDVACFDKTGTLTEENLLVEGVSGLGKDSKELIKTNEAPKETTLVLAAAHALVQLEDGIIGDPMEKNTLEAVEWQLSKDEVVTPKKGYSTSIRILRRFPFSSALKRMSTISSLTQSGTASVFVAVKGAPETLRSMYKNVPEDYDQVYKYWARRGSRVLALGYKYLEKQEPGKMRDLHRDQVESDLIFAGFLIFFCPLKEDSAKAVRMLNNSSHRCVMITGDNALTACHVAKEVEIVTRDVLILDVRDKENAVPTWQSVDEKVQFDADVETIEMDKRLHGYDLCVTGKGLSAIYGKPCFTKLLPRIWVYARVSPKQKEDILTAFKLEKYTTLMCGDGTNDVGALKQAHVGIALLDGKLEDMEKLNQMARLRAQKQMVEKQAELREKMGLPPIALKGAPGAPAVTAEGSTAPRDPKKELAAQLEAMTQMLGEMEGDVPTIKFGDASVAAPFTSKLSTVMSVVNIIRQGRSTLVAMVQMYKILALNCLISAYSMSVMYLAGIKQGDWQATVAGMLITICFFGIAKSSAVETLSKKRPQSNIFNFYIILSVLGQVAIHIASLIYIRAEAIEYSEELDEQIKLDAEFQPNLLNSAVYLVSLIMQVSTFAINYQGEPFRESLVKNKSLYNSIMIVSLIAAAAASEISPDLNDWMQLVPFPDEFRHKLMMTMAFDFGGAWLVEMITLKLFSDNRARAELF